MEVIRTPVLIPMHTHRLAAVVRLTQQQLGAEHLIKVPDLLFNQLIKALHSTH
jgi:hypothetical protein